MWTQTRRAGGRFMFKFMFMFKYTLARWCGENGYGSI
jgi:hypothetical protein